MCWQSCVEGGWAHARAHYRWSFDLQTLEFVTYQAHKAAWALKGDSPTPQFSADLLLCHSPGPKRLKTLAG